MHEFHRNTPPPNPNIAAVASLSSRINSTLNPPTELRLPGPVFLAPEVHEFVTRNLQRPAIELWRALFRSLQRSSTHTEVSPELSRDLAKVLLVIGAIDLNKVRTEWSDLPATSLLALDDAIRLSTSTDGSPTPKTRELLIHRLNEIAMCSPQDDWAITIDSISPVARYSFTSLDNSHTLRRLLALSLVCHPNYFYPIDIPPKFSACDNALLPWERLIGILAKYENLPSERYVCRRFFELSTQINFSQLTSSNTYLVEKLLHTGGNGPVLQDIQNTINSLLYDVECEKLSAFNSVGKRLPFSGLASFAAGSFVGGIGLSVLVKVGFLSTTNAAICTLVAGACTAACLFAQEFQYSQKLQEPRKTAEEAMNSALRLFGMRH